MKNKTKKNTRKTPTNFLFSQCDKDFAIFFYIMNCFFKNLPNLQQKMNTQTKIPHKCPDSDTKTPPFSYTLEVCFFRKSSSI